MSPSTPQPITRSISAASLTVHGITANPNDLASRAMSASRSRKFGDQILPPAAATSRGVELPWAAASSPVHGETPLPLNPFFARAILLL